MFYVIESFIEVGEQVPILSQKLSNFSVLEKYCLPACGRSNHVNCHSDIALNKNEKKIIILNTR